MAYQRLFLVVKEPKARTRGYATLARFHSANSTAAAVRECESAPFFSVEIPSDWKRLRAIAVVNGTEFLL